MALLQVVVGAPRHTVLSLLPPLTASYCCPLAEQGRGASRQACHRRPHSSASCPLG